MLQIGSLEEKKSEWNTNDTQIIVGGGISNKESKEISTDAITMNGENQRVLTNDLENSLVIGVNGNLFENDSEKSDLLVIQNSDFKLLSCSSDSINPVTYTLSYVDEDGREILWESPIFQDKTKSESCSSDKMILEVKDVLNYDDLVKDSSKNDSNNLEKNNEQIILDLGGDLTSQVANIEEGILIQIDDAVNESKKSDNDINNDAQYIVNYYSVVENCEAISMLPTKSTSAEKSVENLNVEKSESLILNEFLVGKNVTESNNLENPNGLLNSDFKETQDIILHIIPDGVVEENDETVSLNNNSNNNKGAFDGWSEQDINSKVQIAELPVVKYTEMPLSSSSQAPQDISLPSPLLSPSHLSLQSETQYKIASSIINKNNDTEEDNCIVADRTVHIAELPVIEYTQEPFSPSSESPQDVPLPSSPLLSTSLILQQPKTQFNLYPSSSNNNISNSKNEDRKEGSNICSVKDTNSTAPINEMPVIKSTQSPFLSSSQTSQDVLLPSLASTSLTLEQTESQYNLLNNSNSSSNMEGVKLYSGKDANRTVHLTTLPVAQNAKATGSSQAPQEEPLSLSKLLTNSVIVLQQEAQYNLCANTNDTNVNKEANICRGKDTTLSVTLPGTQNAKTSFSRFSQASTPLSSFASITSQRSQCNPSANTNINKDIINTYSEKEINRTVSAQQNAKTPFSGSSLDVTLPLSQLLSNSVILLQPDRTNNLSTNSKSNNKNNKNKEGIDICDKVSNRTGALSVSQNANMPFSLTLQKAESQYNLSINNVINNKKGIKINSEKGANGLVSALPVTQNSNPSFSESSQDVQLALSQLLSNSLVLPQPDKQYNLSDSNVNNNDVVSNCIGKDTNRAALLTALPLSQNANTQNYVAPQLSQDVPLSLSELLSNSIIFLQQEKQHGVSENNNSNVNDSRETYNCSEKDITRTVTALSVVQNGETQFHDSQALKDSKTPLALTILVLKEPLTGGNPSAISNVNKEETEDICKGKETLRTTELRVTQGPYSGLSQAQLPLSSASTSIPLHRPEYKLSGDNIINNTKTTSGKKSRRKKTTVTTMAANATPALSTLTQAPQQMSFSSTTSTSITSQYNLSDNSNINNKEGINVCKGKETNLSLPVTQNAKAPFSRFTQALPLSSLSLNSTSVISQRPQCILSANTNSNYKEGVTICNEKGRNDTVLQLPVVQDAKAQISRYPQAPFSQFSQLPYHRRLSSTSLASTSLVSQRPQYNLTAGSKECVNICNEKDTNRTVTELSVRENTNPQNSASSQAPLPLSSLASASLLTQRPQYSLVTNSSINNKDVNACEKHANSSVSALTVAQNAKTPFLGSSHHSPLLSSSLRLERPETPYDMSAKSSNNKLAVNIYSEKDTTKDLTELSVAKLPISSPQTPYDLQLPPSTSQQPKPQDNTTKYNKNKNNNYLEDETDVIKNDYIEESQVKLTKDCKNEEMTTVDKLTDGASLSMPENNLPLKKKAKMKRTLSSGPENVAGSKLNSQKHFIRQDEVNQKMKEHYNTTSPISSGSDSDEPLMSLIKRKKLTKKNKNKAKSKAGPFFQHQIKGIKKPNGINRDVIESDQSDDEARNYFFKNVLNLERKKVYNIYSLIKELKTNKIIYPSVWQTLRSGLKEMNVDILKEMNDKKENESPVNGLSYSAQLKAFALVVYFKQPSAFHHLAKLYNKGWPSLDVIKDWRTKVNRIQRANFIRLHKKPKCIKNQTESPKK